MGHGNLCNESDVKIVVDQANTCASNYFFPPLYSPLTPQPETEQGRRTSLEKFTRSVVSVPLLLNSPH